MIQRIIENVKHVARVLHSKVRETFKGRSPGWRKVRREFLKKNPTCAACGGNRGLEVHHEKPYALEPTLELVETNLVTLCEYWGGKECHLRIGHAGSYKTFNPRVRQHAAYVLSNPEAWNQIVEEAKSIRLANRGAPTPRSP